MRRPFGKLMDLIENDWLNGTGDVDALDQVTLGDLARRYGEDVARILDAIEAVKERAGVKSYV